MIELQEKVVLGQEIAIEPYKRQIVQDQTDEFSTLFVSGFSQDTTEEELLEEFQNYGLVKSCNKIPSKNFAIIQFDNSTQAENAILGFREKLFQGAKLFIDIYKQKTREVKQPNYQKEIVEKEKGDKFYGKIIARGLGNVSSKEVKDVFA